MKLKLHGKYGRECFEKNKKVKSYTTSFLDNKKIINNTVIYKDGNYIVKKIDTVTNNLDFDIDAYKEFCKNNMNFVKIKEFKNDGNIITIVMEYISGITLWEYSFFAPKEKIWNICTTYYWNWIKSFVDFSLNKSKIFFHSDISTHNIIINNDVPYVIDPDSFIWSSKEFFVQRVQENIFDFFDDDPSDKLSLNLFGKL